MSDKKFTFIELHLDGDTQFGPTSIPGLETVDESEEAERDESEEAGAAAEEDSGRGGAIGALVGLVALVAVAVALKKFRGGDDEEIERREEPDVIVN